MTPIPREEVVATAEEFLDGELPVEDGTVAVADLLRELDAIEANAEANIDQIGPERRDGALFVVVGLKLLLERGEDR